jgi:hypothetical protein
MATDCAALPTVTLPEEGVATYRVPEAPEIGDSTVYE